MAFLQESLQQHALREILVDLRQLVAAHGEFLANFRRHTLTEEPPDSLDERSPPHPPWHTRPLAQQPVAEPPRCWALPPSITQPPPGFKAEPLPRLRVDPPRFDGENAQDWIHKIQHYYNNQYMPLHDRLYLTQFLFDHPASEWMTYWEANNKGKGWDDFLLAVRYHFAPKLTEEVDDEEKLVAPDNEDVVIAKDAGTLPLWDELPCDVCPFETLDGIVDDANAVHALIVFETKAKEFVVPTLYDSWRSVTVGIDKWTSSTDYFLLEEICNEDMADGAGDNVVNIAVQCEKPMKEVDGVDSFFYIDGSKLFYELESLGVTKLRLPNCVVDDGILQGEALHIRRVSNDATSFLDLHGDARTIPLDNSFPSRALTYGLSETEI